MTSGQILKARLLDFVCGLKTVAQKVSLRTQKPITEQLKFWHCDCPRQRRLWKSKFEMDAIRSSVLDIISLRCLSSQIWGVKFSIEILSGSSKEWFNLEITKEHVHHTETQEMRLALQNLNVLVIFVITVIKYLMKSNDE